MKKLTELLAEIDTLKAELDKLKPFKREDEERLWKKFRLEWNYNSNHIEGNALTFGQTKLLLMYGEVSGDLKVKDIDEMRAHDVAVKLIQEFAIDKSRSLTEADIRQLNEIILIKPHYRKAKTIEGLPTNKLIRPGVYKSDPNSVELHNGEIFHYASPEETPAKMNELMEWYRKAEKDSALHPIYVAAKMHHEFVRIHPFDDGNGRTSRLLMNFVLLRKEYPPIIIKSAKKESYLMALNRADAGDFEAFAKYIANELKWSLDKAIMAARGRDIEDDEDIYKKIEVFKKENKESINKATPKSREIIVDLIENSLTKLFEILVNDQSKLDEFFVDNRVSISFESHAKEIKSTNDFVAFVNEKLNNTTLHPTFLNNLSFQFYRASRKIPPIDHSHMNQSVDVIFNALNYEIQFVDKKIYKDYPFQLTDDETKMISKGLLIDTYERIKNPKKN